MYNHTEVTSI